MKDFLKMLLASFLGMAVYGALCVLILILCIAGLGSLFNADTTPEMPSKAVLTIDMSEITLTEQTQEMPMMEMLQGIEPMQPMGMLDAIAAINAASFDSAVKYIFLKPDAVTGGIAQIEEFRKALENFRSLYQILISAAAAACDHALVDLHLAVLEFFHKADAALLDAAVFFGVFFTFGKDFGRVFKKFAHGVNVARVEGKGDHGNDLGKIHVSLIGKHSCTGRDLFTSGSSGSSSSGSSGGSSGGGGSSSGGGGGHSF